jgi:hypothetical protein
MSERATCWSVTINNPNKADDENIAVAKQKSGWAVYGQKEVGESGTEHYQLMVTTPQVRFSAVKKAFPRSHIEVARDRKALTKYVSKESTRIGALPTDNKFPSMTTVMAWFGEEFDNYKPFGDGINDHEYLAVFDAMVHKKIREGFYLESMAVNPQIRCAIKMFGRSIANRERARRQTDRQTDENKVEVNSINDASERNEDEAEDEESTSSVDSSASEGSSEESSE